MELLKERIRRDGIIRPGNVLQVDSFLNHQMDVALFREIGQEFARRFAGLPVSKILTVEASGIGIACIAAQYFHVPVVFAKKSRTSNQSPDVYASRVASFTHGNINEIVVSRQYLSPRDDVLILDDFLAVGNAVRGMMDLIRQAGARLTGVGIVIEKGFQSGGDELRTQGIRLESLAIVDAMDPASGVTFRS